ncbi:MAG: endonuclease/exonuclease/phosphatase family protein [Pseudomonadota bacterium]
MLALTTSLWVLTGVLALATLISFSKRKLGVVRGFDFPRQQFLMMALPLAAIFALLQPGAYWQYGLGVLGAVIAVQAFFIIKFTPLWSRQSVAADARQRARTEQHVSLLTCNVKKSNRQYHRLIALIRDREPDVVMAIETDADWIDALKDGLARSYPHWIEVPQDNGYGLCLFSRLALRHWDVRELITRKVPSIRTSVILRGGRPFRLYVVHPEPPSYEQDTLGRDSELAMVGLEAKKDPLPTVVSGDLNDVAWSTTTRRFQRLSKLLDPRVGRGFYNTFSATMPWMRWPLDHLFHDARFRLVEMARERKVGSDHFPMWFVLCLADSDAINSDPGMAEPGEVMQAKREIVAQRRKDRDPIGEDWENEDI